MTVSMDGFKSEPNDLTGLKGDGTDLTNAAGTMRCANCGYMLALHHHVNFADGPLIGAPIDVCPTAVFKPYSKVQP
jgi:hypothetical protein